VFDNKALRRILECKTEKEKVEWKKLQEEEINNLYFSLNTNMSRKSRKN
jgi:hypothetical protein